MLHNFYGFRNKIHVQINRIGERSIKHVQIGERRIKLFHLTDMFHLGLTSKFYNEQANMKPTTRIMLQFSKMRLGGFNYID